MVDDDSNIEKEIIWQVFYLELNIEEWPKSQDFWVDLDMVFSLFSSLNEFLSQSPPF